MAEGLDFLHASHTIHGDLKGVSALSGSFPVTSLTLGQPNILVDDRGHACLADFGLASVAHGHNSIATHLHGYTARWTAPEILRGAPNITKEADVFSFGMVVLEVRPRFLSLGMRGGSVFLTSQFLYRHLQENTHSVN